MESLIIGNLCSFFAMITDSVSASRRSAKGMLIMQTLSQLFYIVGAIVLKGYSAAVQNAVSIVRNIVAISGVNNMIIGWILIAAGVVFGIMFNNMGAIGWLPIIGNLEYSVSIFYFKKNQRALKLAFAICLALYAVFNIVILNFVGAASNFVVFVTTVIMLIKGK